ncbi:hypothetical protein SLE2022_041410 [Rubroshorea leprosula]
MSRPPKGEKSRRSRSELESRGDPGSSSVRASYLTVSFSHVSVIFSMFLLADEEVADQKKYFEESCKPKCVKPLLEYQACVKRIQGDETGHKHCTGQYFDYWSCIDKCVAPKLFTKLK